MIIPMKRIRRALKYESTFEVDGLPIVLDPAYKNISIDVSGGADSALVTFLILQELNIREQDCTVHIISHHRCWKTKPWQGYISKEVYDYIYENYRGYVDMVRHTNFIPEGLESKSVNSPRPDGTDRTGEMICVDEYREKLIQDLNIDMSYNCTTMNPPISFAQEGMPFRDHHDGMVDRENIVDYKEPCCNPLIYVNKSWVLKQYKEHNILDLLYVTRSCEMRLTELSFQMGLKEDLELKDWDGERPREDCGKCFWCYERHWAMDENEVPYYA